VIIKNLDDVKGLQPTLFWSLAIFDGRWLRKYKENKMLKALTATLFILTLFAGAALADATVDLAWDANPTEPDNYILEYSTDNGATWAALETVPGNVTTAKVIVPNYSQLYSFQCKAQEVVDGQTYISGPSNVVVTAVIMTPSNLRIE
jgi:Neuraminidase (sialidase)